ncbi:hypothetical protein Tco_0085386 [Tanacetum coccineum]
MGGARGRAYAINGGICSKRGLKVLLSGVAEVREASVVRGCGGGDGSGYGGDGDDEVVVVVVRGVMWGDDGLFDGVVDVVMLLIVTVVVVGGWPEAAPEKMEEREVVCGVTRLNE